MVGGAGSTQAVRTLAQCAARVQESCAPLLLMMFSVNLNLLTPKFQISCPFPLHTPDQKHLSTVKALCDISLHVCLYGKIFLASDPSPRLEADP
jgi:hypothetical protein